MRGTWIDIFDVPTHREVVESSINPVFVTGCRMLDISASRLVKRIGSYVSQADRGNIEYPVISYHFIKKR